MAAPLRADCDDSYVALTAWHGACGYPVSDGPGQRSRASVQYLEGDMMKRIWAATIVAALAVSAPAFAQAPAKTPTGPFGGDITGIVTFANEYSFRGISQTTRDFAVQGGLTY